MKPLKAILASASILFLFQCCGFAQHKQKARKSIIFTKTVLLSYIHNDSSVMEDHTDTLDIPIVSDDYPGLKKALAFENIGDEDGLDSVKSNYARCGCGLFNMSYEVTYESKDIISLKVYTEGMGAYPTSSTKWLTYNIHTGKRYQIKNEMNTAGLKWIYNTYKTLLRKRIAEDRKENKTRTEEDQEEYDSAYQQEKESIDTLGFDEMLHDYVFTDTGIVFTTDGILPHAIQALEPDREWTIPYKRLLKYRKPHALVLK